MMAIDRIIDVAIGCAASLMVATLCPSTRRCVGVRLRPRPAAADAVLGAASP